MLGLLTDEARRRTVGLEVAPKPAPIEHPPQADLKEVRDEQAAGVVAHDWLPAVDVVVAEDLTEYFNTLLLDLLGIAEAKTGLEEVVLFEKSTFLVRS